MSSRRTHLEKVASLLKPQHQADKQQRENKKYPPVNSTKSGCNSTKEEVRSGGRNMHITYPTILYLTTY